MVEAAATTRRRRMGAPGMMFRRRRIFAELREGFTYEEIAAEEGVSNSRIRQIVSQELQQRAIDSGAEHAKLQLDRLAPAVQLGAEAIAAGDVSAITPYLKALDRLDRYQTVASANQVYDDEARKKLLDKITASPTISAPTRPSRKRCRRTLRRPARFPTMSRARPRGRGRTLRGRRNSWERRARSRHCLRRPRRAPDFFT
jgi:hypothetical protein